MTTQQSQQFVAPQGQAQLQNEMQRNSDPFWYRQNAQYLYNVTAAASNAAFGIENISLTPASANQTPYGILANGVLKSGIGSISFQVRLSKNNAPFVSTVSTAVDKDKGEYWEHINLKTQVKAQILRHFEALQTGQVPPDPMQFNGMQGMQQGMPYNNGMNQGMMPMNGMQQNMGMPMNNGMQQNPYAMQGQGMQFNNMQPNNGFNGGFGGMQQQQTFPQYNQQTYTPPAPVNTGSPVGQPQDQQQTQEQSSIQDDDLPV